MLISIDTLRADHLSCYGYNRRTSPHIDAFAAGSVLFERAYSTANQTADSHMSMFTSVYPTVHRVTNSTGATGHRLDSGIATLPEILSAQGYATAGFHGGGNVSATYGFDRGFDEYTAVREIGASVGNAITWVRRPRTRPFFLFFHTYHVHDPYTPRAPADRRFDPDYSGPVVSDEATLETLAASASFSDLRTAFWAPVDPRNRRDVDHVIALYDSEIAEMDLEIGRLLAALDDHDIETATETLVFLVSDHGEEFQEHRRFRHTQLYQEILHVPLIVHHPRHTRGRRVLTRVSLIDLAPTILDLASAPRPPHFQGTTLRPVIQGVPGAPEIMAEKVFPATDHGRNNHVALIVGDKKLLLKAQPELFDLVRDPLEQSDISEADPSLQRLVDQARELNQENKAIGRSLNSGTASEVELDEETTETLKALGYVQ